MRRPKRSAIEESSAPGRRRAGLFYIILPTLMMHGQTHACLVFVAGTFLAEQTNDRVNSVGISTHSAPNHNFDIC